MNDVERTAMQADNVSHLVNQLSDAVQALAVNVHGGNVTVLIPEGFDAMDNVLRQAALVLSTLGMASSARTQGFDFDPTPTVEGSDRLIALAQDYATKLHLLSEES